MTTENACALCGNKPADRGLMCAAHRAQDAQIHAGCKCAVCRSDLAKIVACENEDRDDG